MNLREYLHFLSYTKTLEELWDAHCRQMEKYGFVRLLYGHTQYRTETSLGDPEDFVILTNHCQEYLDGFLHSGLYFHAPMLKWALKHEGAASWRLIGEMMASNVMTSQERKVYEFNKSMGVTSGYTVSFNSVSMRSKGAISLCAENDTPQDELDAMWEEHGQDILLMNNMAHLKILTLPYNAPNRSLTKRQREALQWVGDGKTTQDIALLMGLTPATVEKHLRLAREALSVETTAQAVLKASLHNQMFVMER
ncbi:LuxR family transcriptional regulator [Ruegeria marisrubri]|uniref:LuxR family transcriptional regulator n=1 Tax=Ruegeria marisrubri TaxID=1685379 RepID=A0A101CZD8_9RHOB|nr:autoinducer binding domain-containing protein [Ruegeria marisrubri]KUJ86020.1 LuxR family transcriptional regulator [Ruegeria marisrubri]